VTPLGQQTRPLSWKEVALRLGEELSSAGPNGYYGMTPNRWLEWALKQVKNGPQDR
jgi:hypothetical protein